MCILCDQGRPQKHFFSRRKFLKSAAATGAAATALSLFTPRPAAADDPPFGMGSPGRRIVIRNGACATKDGTTGTADVTITMEDDDLVSLMKGDLNGMTAFMTGKLQLEGDLMLAQRMFGFFDSSKLG